VQSTRHAFPVTHAAHADIIIIRCMCRAHGTKKGIHAPDDDADGELMQLMRQSIMVSLAPVSFCLYVCIYVCICTGIHARDDDAD
jgi:hypothetical protein